MFFKILDVFENYHSHIVNLSTRIDQNNDYMQYSGATEKKKRAALLEIYMLHARIHGAEKRVNALKKIYPSIWRESSFGDFSCGEINMSPYCI